MGYVGAFFWFVWAAACVGGLYVILPNWKKEEIKEWLKCINNG